jgi:hypothetical protein
MSWINSADLYEKMVFTAYLDFIVGWFAVSSMQADCLSIFIWSISDPFILSCIIGGARLNVGGGPQ